LVDIKSNKDRQHACLAYLESTKTSWSKVHASSALLIQKVLSQILLSAIYAMLGKRHQTAVQHAKIVQLVRLLPVAKAVVQENIVATTIQLLHVWIAELVRTMLKQINLAAYRVFLESTKTKKEKLNASSVMVASIVVPRMLCVKVA
jgi:hypothetical protein